jgi:aspartyl-tRNA(Asn)/glutamyl-tRNA(Gln) amidotransferase subunit C
MKVTEKDVMYVADLANLELTDEERGRMLHDLNSILEYMDRLNQLDTSNVEPMAQTSDRYGAGTGPANAGLNPSSPGATRFAYALRDDVVEGLRKSLPRDQALANAPATDGVFFKVPKVIER